MPKRQTAGTPAKKSPAAADQPVTRKVKQMVADHETRALAGTIGAHTSWANTTDRSARTAPARAALEKRFLEEADGDPVRAAHLRQAYYARLALKSVRARRLKAEAAAAELELRALGGGDAA